MRCNYLILLAAAAPVASSPAAAADALKFGGPPTWVVPETVPPASDKAKDRPIALLLHDQQTMLEPGRTSTFSELAFKIQKPEGLAAGNLSIAWNPATDTITVNTLEIRRGEQVIDILKSGQTFTTLRRESNLDLATLDGVLTANIQPEGLREGDVVVLATTTDHADPVLKGHVEATFAPWGDAQIGLAHARLSWPSTLDVRVQKTGDLPAVQQSVRDGRKIYELTMRDVDPVIDPKGAPVRFQIGRMGEATDFRSWADAAKLMIPLYRAAAVIPASGPLRDEVEKIRKGSSDPRVRAEQALQLVQQRIRYVALVMGQGGYVPAPAETTWSRRFGDCKAKTALLLAILHELGIEAQPVAVNASVGDIIADRLPSIGMFNHVLVRAQVAGKSYWLDGTRTGDTSLDRIKVPNFGWGLPLVENAALVHIVPQPLDVPDSETRITIDATAGVFAPAKVTVTQVFRGDAAVAFNSGFSQLSANQRTEFLHQNTKQFFDTVSGDTATVEFDDPKSELRILSSGTAKLDWRDGWFTVPQSSIGYTPDFERPAGPRHDVPIATTYPNFDKRSVTIKLPPNFAAGQTKLPTAVNETLAGIEYARAITLAGDILTVESSNRSIAPEVPYKTALADAPRLKSLDNDDVYLRVPNAYRASAQDLEGMSTEQPSSAHELFERGVFRLNANKYDDAIADFTHALQLEPKDVWTLANRGMTYVWKRDFAAAEKDLSAAEAIDANNQVAIRARALLAEGNGDYKSAVAIYSRALVRDPGDNFARYHRAYAYRSMGENEKALADSEQSLKVFHDPDLRLLRANIFVLQGNNAAAANEAKLLESENPDSDFAWVAAGRIYGRIGPRSEATLAFDRALAIKPQAYVYLNRSLIRPPSDVAGRMADVDAALKLQPDSPEALAEKARLLVKTGNYKDALAALDRIKPEPSDRYTQVQRAVVLHKVGRNDEARKLLVGIRAASKSALEFNNLCWAEATADLFLESALEDCREALKLSPEMGGYLDSLGMVLLKLERLDEALDAYNRAVAKNAGAASLMGRAFVYLRKGDRAHAEADAAAARKLSADIDNTFAEYGLELNPKPTALPGK